MTEAAGSGYDPHRGPRDRMLRVGDAEREAVGEILRRHHVAGRLDASEFEERLERSLTAKTYGELDRLIEDLPSEGRPRGRLASRRRRHRAYPVPLPFLLVPAALVAAIALGHGHLAWLVFPLLFFFVVRPLLWRSWH